MQSKLYFKLSLIVQKINRKLFFLKLQYLNYVNKLNRLFCHRNIERQFKFLKK